MWEVHEFLKRQVLEVLVLKEPLYFAAYQMYYSTDFVGVS